MASDAAAEDPAPTAEQAEAPEEQPEVAEEQAEPAQEPAEPVVASEPSQPAPVQKPFPGNIIDAITNNPLYQVALGGGLIVLLLLLLLLARRNANREKAFYDQLNSETDGDDTDSFDLTFDEDETSEVPDNDAIAEADAYIAYGRNDQAAQTLETAISRETSRTDLRLKLLGVYADIQDRESFDKQFREIEALDDEVATEEAASIQARLEETESMPSIDDLESQLRSGGTDQAEDDDFEAEDLDLDLPETDSEDDFADEPEEKRGVESEESDDDLIEYDLSGFELEEDETPETSEAAEPEKSDEPEESDDSFEYTLDELDTDADELETAEDDDLSLDFESSDSELEDEGTDEGTKELPKEEAPDTGEKEDSAATESDDSDLPSLDDDGELDESFLDELDAELDKVANEDDSSEDVDGSEMDDLELDVSDEDLALMEEFSESDEASPSDKPEKDDEDLSLDDELGLEDALQGEEPAGDSPSEPSDEEAPEPDDSILPPVASDKTSGDDSDFDESDLGDDDDFGFLSGTDEAATKLDLARAYVEMGDVDGARDILEEVALEGNDEQKTEAQDLLKNLS